MSSVAALEIETTPFAEGAVRAAEWLSTHTGVHDFHEVFTEL